MRARAAAPVLLLATALAAVVALPEVALLLMEPRRPGEAAGMMRAAVAWSRIIAIILALGAALLLARSARASRGRVAIVLLTLCAGIGLAAALPAYDAWLEQHARERYAIERWRADPSFMPGPESLSFSLQLEVPNATGETRVDLPPLARGDAYMVSAVFGDDDATSFWKSHVSASARDACMRWDGQQPTPADDRPLQSSFLLQCDATHRGERAVFVAWGDPATPVPLHVGVLVRPVAVGEVHARADESLLLVAIIAGTATALSHAVASRGAPRSSLAFAPLLVCVLWGAAAVMPRVERFWPPRDWSVAISFALVALAAAAFCAWRLRSIGGARVADAARTSAYAASLVAALAPIAATRIWRHDVPWVVLAIVGTFLVAGATLLALRGPRDPSRAALPAA